MKYLLNNYFSKNDERIKFNDISKIPVILRKQKSPVIQFYSAYPNIGNYTPVLGIQKMLNHVPDTWNVHENPVDFKYINKKYEIAIIGGAGLLHEVFTPFWSDFSRNCNLPLIIWGIGGCFVDYKHNSVVNPKIASPVFERAEYINVRDSFTADFYDIKKAHISACPTIEWLRILNPNMNNNNDIVLYVSHTELIPKHEQLTLYNVINMKYKNWLYTDNIQKNNFGLQKIIQNLYCRSSLVITTRLHGAIIATGLGIPYIALARDEKLRSFNKEWGCGYIANNISEISVILNEGHLINYEQNILMYENIRDFGKTVYKWMINQGVSI